MAGKSKRPRLVLTSEEQKQIRQLRESQTEPWREVQRARILWGYHSGQSVTEIGRAVKMTRKSVAKWIAKALAMGVGAALKDTYHRPKTPVITEEAKAWVVHLACSKPKELGYAAEVWTRKSLARHVRGACRGGGTPRLIPGRQSHGAADPRGAAFTSGEGKVLSGAARPRLHGQDARDSTGIS